MIFALLARLGLPQRLLAPVAYIGGALLVIALLWLLKGCIEDSAIREHEREIAAEVEHKSTEASHAATDAAHATKSDVETRNEQARDAANSGDDYLGDGLRSLRGTASHRPAAR